MDFLTGFYADFFALWSELHTLFLVDGHDPIYFGNRIGRALFDAGLIMNTPDFADRFRDLSAVRGAASDDDSVALGDQLDNPLGASGNASAAGHALVRVDHRKVVHHGNRIKRAGCNTFPKADTAVLARRRASKGQMCT